MPGAKPVRPTIAMQMQAVPVRNQAISVRDDADGIALTQTLHYGWWLRPLRRLLHLPETRVYRLEGIAVVVWRLLDDTATIGEIVEAFAAQRSLSYHESRAMLMSYFRLLVNRGVIAIVGFDTTLDHEAMAI
jgi:hypothetical protein